MSDEVKNDTFSPAPWELQMSTTPNGISAKIVDANGGVVALLKHAGGRKITNGILIMEACNEAIINNGLDKGEQL